MTPRAVVFDLDGTLVDLDVDIEAARERIRALVAPLGFDRPLRPLLQRVREAAALAPTESGRRGITARAHAILDDEEARAARAAVARPGAAEAVEALARAGLPLAIVTDNGRGCVGPALASAGIPARFRAVVGRDDVAWGKPDPDGLSRAAAALVPGGGELWVVGDSPRDIGAARGVADRRPELVVRAVGVLGGRGRAADLEDAGADEVVAALDRVLARLKAPGEVG